MKVRILVPIELEIKGDDVSSEVHEQLNVIKEIVDISELDSESMFLTSEIEIAKIVE